MSNIKQKNINKKKEIGKVTQEERDEIKALFERKNGLTELTKSLVGLKKEELDNSYLYEKIINDMGQVLVGFQEWWDKMNKKYNWENIAGYKWEIDFETCVIFLVKQ